MYVSCLITVMPTDILLACNVILHRPTGHISNPKGYFKHLS